MAANKVTITGLGRHDGEYEFGNDLTNRDLHEIKKIAGVRAGELVGAIQAKDNDIAVAFAFVILPRHGKQVTLDELWDLPVGAIRVEFDDEEVEEADAGPPAPEPIGPEGQGKNDDLSAPDGKHSPTGGDNLASIRPVTGGPPSEHGSGSDPAISAI